MIPIKIREAFFSHIPKTVSVEDQTYQIGWRVSREMPRDFALPAILVWYSDEKCNPDRSPLNQLIGLEVASNGMLQRVLGERLQSLVTMDIYAEDSVDLTNYVSRDRLAGEIVRLLDVWRMSALEDDLQQKGSGVESRSALVDLSHLEEREWARIRVEFIVGYWHAYSSLINPIDMIEYNTQFGVGTKILNLAETSVGFEEITKEEI